jgi:hypothetical protein
MIGYEPKRGGKEAKSRVRLAVVTCPPFVLSQWVCSLLLECNNENGAPCEPLCGDDPGAVLQQHAAFGSADGATGTPCWSATTILSFNWLGLP